MELEPFVISDEQKIAFDTRYLRREEWYPASVEISNSNYQVVASGATDLITYDTLSHATDSGMYDLANERIVCVTAGYYHVYCTLTVQSTGSSGDSEVEIRKNGVAGGTFDTISFVVFNRNENIKIGATILLAAGDYFDMTLQNSSGGDQLVLGGIYRMFGMFRVA